MIMNDTIIGLGTTAKVNIHIEPIGGLHMNDLDFTAKFTSGIRSLIVKKEEMTKVDNDNYIANVNTGNLGAGQLHLVIQAEIPDADVLGGVRHEVTPPINTKITLVK